MNTLAYTTMDGAAATLSAAAVRSFAIQISGGVLARGDEDYDEARAVWNGMVDRRPALIARCRSERDVQAAVRFAADTRMLASVRGGGHHIAGNAVAEGGLMIDLSGMRSVEVDPMRRVARVEPGALLADFDREAQAHGLATPLGINSTTGVAGLTLGGGFGWLTRSYGMTVDNLLGATIVTADGLSRRVSERVEPDLFWAIRGGGGNFGVVTSFEFRLHAVGPQVHAGLVVYPFDGARRVLRAWRDFAMAAPDALTVWAVLRKAPPLPFLPESAHGKPVVILPLVHAGSLEAGASAAAPVLRFGTPLGAAMGPTPYTAFQSVFDPLLAPGARNYWKSNDFAPLGDAALDLAIDAARSLPGPACEIFLAQLGGAMGRVPASATAYAGRDARFVMNVHGRWTDPADDAAVIGWARAAYRATVPFATGSAYVNFLTADEAGRVATAYGGNYARLQAVKRRFDPQNVFRMNLNIAPAAAAERAAESS